MSVSLEQVVARHELASALRALGYTDTVRLWFELRSDSIWVVTDYPNEWHAVLDGFSAGHMYVVFNETLEIWIAL